MNSNDSTIPPHNQSNNDDSGDATVDLDKLIQLQQLKFATEQAKQGKRTGNTASADTSLTQPTFRLMSDTDLAGLPPQSWFVKGIIPDTGIGTIFGDSMTFKSFLALDLLAHVAHGRDWFGKRVKRAPCVYVPLEGRGGIPKRVEAWCQAQTALGTQFSVDPITMKFMFSIPPKASTGIAFVMEPLNLRNDADRSKLITTLLNANLGGGILLIDTLAQAGGGLDENTSEGMGELIRIMQDLQRALGGVVPAVHHSGKDASKGMRGHSSLRAALDFAIECERLDGLTAQFKLDKVKDEMDGAQFPFTMQRVALGYDEDGDMVSSLVVEHEPSAQPVMSESNAAVINTEVDEFVLDWIRREVENRNFPSQRSLSGKVKVMREQCAAIKTRIEVRDAVARLISAERLVEDKFGAPGGQKSLQPVHMVTTVAVKE